MPVSRRRKTRRRLPTAARPTAVRKRPQSPPWVGATILALFAIGIVWLVLYYTTGGGIVGQRALGGWNVLVGFGFIIGGFGLSTQWH